VIPWRFILFGLGLALAVYLHFFFAHRQWRRLKGKHSFEIDVDYIRMENFIPQSFRLKVKEWLQLPDVTEGGAGERIIRKGKEEISVTGPLVVEEAERSNQILIVEGDFKCGPECEFDKEIYVEGDARIGRETSLQSLAADGNLVLEDGVSVARWIDSAGEMVIGSGCRAVARITSQTAIRLGKGTKALSVFAREVSTPGWQDRPAGATTPVPETLLELPSPADGPMPAEVAQKAGLDAGLFTTLGSESWRYAGDFEPSVPLRIKGNLIVKGHCRLPEGSVVEGNLKTAKWLVVGARSVCEGSVVAGGDLCIGSACVLRGVTHAGGSVLVRSGVRARRDGALTVVYSGEQLLVETDVFIAGKLAAAGGVLVADPDEGEKWIEKRQRHSAQFRV